MSHPLESFTVVLQLSSADEPAVLCSTADPNTATLAFHEELQRLTTQGATGELLLLNHDQAHIPLLRQPLASPASRPAPTRRR